MTERHNAILANMNDKPLLDESSSYPVDVIFAWAVSAKNTLRKCYGFMLPT